MTTVTSSSCARTPTAQLGSSSRLSSRIGTAMPPSSSVAMRGRSYSCAVRATLTGTDMRGGKFLSVGGVEEVLWFAILRREW